MKWFCSPTAVVGITCGVAHFFFRAHMSVIKHITSYVSLAPLTYSVVPSIDGKQSAASDSNHSGYSEVGQGVGSHMGYRRIGWKLQHHDDILLHLVFEHERTLWKETLLSRRAKTQKSGKKMGGHDGERRWAFWGKKKGAGQEGMKKMICRGMNTWKKNNVRRISVEVWGKSRFKNRGTSCSVTPWTVFRQEIKTDVDRNTGMKKTTRMRWFIQKNVSKAFTKTK